MPISSAITPPPTRRPEEIHQLGLSEVARIRAEMDALAKKSGFASREAMIADMRTNPKYFAKTPEELMLLTARMTKRIDGKMPALFGRLPRLPYTIKEIPAAIAEGTTTAYYNQGSPEAGLPGTYYVNTSKLDQRPLWEIPALTVHEAVPGHHHQIALQQELDMPEWRKNTAFFTAFVEGWGLYSERLGIEMGLYDTPQKDMGRLGYEMWRAARLVVDTGIHAKGWDKARAVAFMKDNTTLTDANIDAEVNRYISNPGQALAYKMGELKIRELRALAEKELGPKFDLRHFHDAVLLPGTGAAGHARRAGAGLDRGGESAGAKSRARRLIARARSPCSAASLRSWRACLITWIRQPVKPPGPTGEQLLVPVAPTVSSALALIGPGFALSGGVRSARSFSGMR